MKRFNLIKHTINRLKPKKEDIELNKCNHEEIDEEGKCILCGTTINLNLSGAELNEAAKVVIDHLESMKLASALLDKKERKAAKKYFDMIPLLKNIESLYNICSERINELNEIVLNDDNKPLDIISPRE